MEEVSISFHDSMSFFNTSLAKLAKDFGLDEDKGYFPHKFPKRNNREYNDKYPDKQYYDYYKKSVKEIITFDEWYEPLMKNTFNL